MKYWNDNNMDTWRGCYCLPAVTGANLNYNLVIGSGDERIMKDEVPDILLVLPEASGE